MKKYVILLVTAVAVMLGLMGAVQYFMAKENTERELLVKAARDLEESKRVAAVKTEVETAVRNVLTVVRQNLSKPDHYYTLSTQMVRNTPHIVGAGVAFKPNYYLQMGKNERYAPYAYDEQPDVKLKNARQADRRYVPNFCHLTIPSVSGIRKRWKTAKLSGPNHT